MTRPTARDNSSHWPFALVYYRVYTKDSAIPSREPANREDCTVGCIRSDTVPPPHTAASIKRCISHKERFSNWERSQLFETTDSLSPIGGRHILLLTDDHIGSTPENPILFVESEDSTFWTRIWPRDQSRTAVMSEEFVRVSSPNSIFEPNMRVNQGWSQLKFKPRKDYSTHLFSSPQPPESWLVNNQKGWDFRSRLWFTSKSGVRLRREWVPGLWQHCFDSATHPSFWCCVQRK